MLRGSILKFKRVMKFVFFRDGLVFRTSCYHGIYFKKVVVCFIEHSSSALVSEMFADIFDTIFQVSGEPQ